MGKASTVKPTAQETEQAAIHAEQWERYESQGIPLENEWIRRTSGYTMNAETGEYVPDTAGGVRNADGSVVTDSTTANVANEKAYGDVMRQSNPNRLEQATAINREGATQGALSSTEMELGQQSNANLGVVNAVAHGKGLEGEALQRQDQLTAQAQQDAFSSADASASRRATNSYLAGSVVGAAGVGYDRMKTNNSANPLPTVNPHTK